MPGEVVPTPEPQPLEVVPTAKAKSRARTLRDVYDRWKVSGVTARSADSIAAYGRAVSQFEGQHPALPWSHSTVILGDFYRAWLVTACKTPKTAPDPPHGYQVSPEVRHGDPGVAT